MTVQAAFAATLVDEWSRSGVSDAVISPGSRSTPLALALDDHPGFRLHVVLDERSAGFYALGMGLASGQPAVVLTTSGTAAVELHPAVVEAHHARVPLIVCTADRPPELHHVGAPQTVEQSGLFAGVVRWAADPGVADVAAAPTWRSLAARAVAEAVVGPAGPGPVHLNLAFREPLVSEGTAEPGRPGSAPWHRRSRTVARPDPAVVAAIAADAGSGALGLVVAGAGSGDPRPVHDLAAALRWPVLADPRSGCRLPGPSTVAAADALLRAPGFADRHRPDVVLRLGGPWASRAMAEWLAALDVPQYLVDPYGAWLDPGRSATGVVAADPEQVCDALVGQGLEPAPPEWLSSWSQAEAAAQRAIDEVLGRHPEPTEPGVARTVADVVPDGAALVASSSMPVRDVEWYARPRHGVRVFSNRGANGIDGVTSTVLGVAARNAGPTVGLVGDLAFLHDASGLLVPRWAAGRLDCTLVVVDNDGGGIFSFLPQAEQLAAERFERLLGTPQGLDLAAVAGVYGVTAVPVTTAADLGPAVEKSLAGGGVRIVHVRTDRLANVAVHEELHAAVEAAVGGGPAG